MTVVDLLVIAVLALAALRGWRRGGTALVLSATGAVAGVLVLGAVARWYDAASVPLALGAAIVGALVGWALGRRVAAGLARRTGGGLRRPGLPDRVLGVVAHTVFALGVCVTVAAVVGATGPAAVADAAARSDVLGAAAQRLPSPATVLDTAGLGTVDGAVPGATR